MIRTIVNKNIAVNNENTFISLNKLYDPKNNNNKIININIENKINKNPQFGPNILWNVFDIDTNRSSLTGSSEMGW